MPHLKDLSTSLFNRSEPVSGGLPLPQPPEIQSATCPVYPSAPKLQHQKKPTEIAVTDLKYNAFNIDRLKLNIISCNA